MQIKRDIFTSCDHPFLQSQVRENPLFRPQETELPWCSRTADRETGLHPLGSKGGDAEPLPLFQVTDGCGSPLHRLRSPLHSGPGSPASGSFCLEPPGLRRSLDEDEPPPSPLARYRPLHNAASHEGLAATSGSPPRSAPSSDSSPSFVRRYPRAEPHSEGEPGRRGAPCRRASEPQLGQAVGWLRERWKAGHQVPFFIYRGLISARHRWTQTEHRDSPWPLGTCSLGKEQPNHSIINV